MLRPVQQISKYKVYTIDTTKDSNLRPYTTLHTSRQLQFGYLIPSAFLYFFKVYNIHEIFAARR